MLTFSSALRAPNNKKTKGFIRVLDNSWSYFQVFRSAPRAEYQEARSLKVSKSGSYFSFSGALRAPNIKKLEGSFKGLGQIRDALFKFPGALRASYIKKMQGIIRVWGKCRSFLFKLPGALRAPNIKKTHGYIRVLGKSG